VVSAADLSFLHRSRYFFFQVAPSALNYLQNCTISHCRRTSERWQQPRGTADERGRCARPLDTTVRNLPPQKSAWRQPTWGGVCAALCVVHLKQKSDKVLQSTAYRNLDRDTQGTNIGVQLMDVQVRARGFMGTGIWRDTKGPSTATGCSPTEAGLHEATRRMKNCVFWDVTPCGSCKNRRFGRTWRLHRRGDKNR
jgi:hypothetical protein